MTVRYLGAFLLLACSAGAQDYRARVQGVITDTTQAVIPGATVTLTHNDTGVATTRQTLANGQYLFDFVEPGTYTLTVEHPGFQKMVQQNIAVQVRGDVTVNAVLTLGGVAESITVAETPAAVQFNTSTMELTVDRKMLNELPTLSRNPFTLALLDPSVVNRYRDPYGRNPFNMWAAADLDVGGSTKRKNDLLLDGAPLQVGPKGSYSPPMDAVQEFSVQQNSVDAEFGHSAGGIMSISMKSGTNELHGTAYYFGRNPVLNAATESVQHTPNQRRNHIWGATAGGPVRKNRLFTFATYEGWRSPEPEQRNFTVPTPLERTGDFSQAINGAGGMRVIFDPYSTIFDSATGKVTRTAFPGNRIPTTRQDPTAVMMMKDIWLPNGPGDDATRVNNYRTVAYRVHHYWNFSDRTDWNINDRWKMYARYSRFANTLKALDYAQSRAANINGGIMKSRNAAVDTVYTLTPRTVLNFRASYAGLEDDFDSPDTELTQADYAAFWPNNPWYKSYFDGFKKLYYPSITLASAFGRKTWWWQHPRTVTEYGRISSQQGPHYLKAGYEGRQHNAQIWYPAPLAFNFAPALTASTFIQPNTKLNGDATATFLLGAVNTGTAQVDPEQEVLVRSHALYFQDDYKLSRRITLNLGLRYEYETAPMEAQNRFSRYLDLTSPIPEMQSSPPPIPANVAAMMRVPYQFNGAWVFSDAAHRGMYETNHMTFMPRAGVALRVNDRTAIRFGYARYVIPPLVIQDTISGLPMDGFSATTDTLPVLEGIPRARLSDPFPASNPLIMPVAKSLGRYTNLGGDASWDEQRMRTGVNDRFNLSLQRQLPLRFTTDVTFFMNLGHDLPYTKNVNQMDPQLSYTYKSALAKAIPNPFYQYLTPEKFPGQLRNLATVTVGSLLHPYPQYLSVQQTNTHGALSRYRALQLRLQRPFSRGASLLVTYNYNREKDYEFFNADDQYINHFTFIPAADPRHRLNIAGTWDLPVGRNRRLLGRIHPVLNAIAGGWAVSPMFTYNSGSFLRFGNMTASGDPRISDPSRKAYFDTSKFRLAEPYTPRTNPWQYEGVTGPRNVNLDATLAKYFQIKEGMRLELRMEAYNVTNSFMAAAPNVNVNSSLFGRSTSQGNRGRELQYCLKLQF